MKPYAAHLQSLAFLLVKSSADPEIDDLKIPLVLVEEHDVLGLQIAMHDVVGVAMLDGGQQLLQVEARFVFSQISLLDDAVEQLPALAQIHHDVDVLLLGVDVVDADDARVVLYYSKSTNFLSSIYSYKLYSDFFLFSMRFTARVTFVLRWKARYTLP